MIKPIFLPLFSVDPVNQWLLGMHKNHFQFISTHKIRDENSCEFERKDSPVLVFQRHNKTELPS